MPLVLNGGYFHKAVLRKNTIFSQEETEELNEFKKTFKLNKWNQLDGKLILDAGCGSGRLSSNVAQERKIQLSLE